ncbi:MAG: outer membrane protein assembly factor BamD [Bacteroidales bacterium]|jgi:outer membrane protein assembly factor BamD|nr:outer membrane protein assembly factor BamD [Bacteroidales bacterium]
MKKIDRVDFNLLIFLILCLFFGDAFAATREDLYPKHSSTNFFAIDETAEMSIAPIDIKSNKKRTRSRKSSGKVNFETFRQYYDKALKFYNNKAYLSAARIFEELYPLSIGTPVGDTILFLFADSYFQNHDYQMAAFHFKDYSRRYPGTERAELAAFNAVQAMYYTSPEYYLDQFITTMAIEEVNLYIQHYPYSKHIEECNEILDALHDKLAKKDMEMVRLYYQTGYYEAAQLMARNFLKTFPSSKYAPEVLFILIRNNYDFARKSVEQKKYSRYKDCIDAYEKLHVQYPESNYIADGKKIANEAENQLKKIEERKK